MDVRGELSFGGGSGVARERRPDMLLRGADTGLICINYIEHLNNADNSSLGIEIGTSTNSKSPWESSHA